MPSILSQGVFVRPFLLSNAEWMAWFEGGACARVKRLRFTCEEEDAPGRLLEDAIDVRIVRADDLVPRPVTDVERVARYPMFTTAPVRLSTRFPWYPAEVAGESVLVVHAPSDMTFDVRPGRWKVTGTFGILDGAWETGVTDGVNFAVVLLDERGKEQAPVFKRLLQPVGVERDRGPQTFELELDVPRRMPVYLRTRPGPMADTNSDWAWWSKLEFRRLGDVAPR
ncbi:MAG: hypothetical protein IPJ77_06700 [Planctomycetes bacterium]|nr:hypothetical protein [Planctomycetota bacterium]